MNGETGDCNTPVRRSSRARKPNSRFADDELDGCFKKIVTGVATPESSTGSSLVATPTRQKKGGKKRESESEDVDDNTSGSKETTPISNVVGVVAGSQTKQDDIVNGLVNESEALADNMGKAKSSQDKPQERRTRSNAKKDPLESLPNEERKRGGKKGAKVKGKGMEEGKATTKSDSEGGKVTNENLSEFLSKITSLQVVEHRESTTVNDPLPVSKDKKKGKPVEDLDTTPVKEKVISVEDERGIVTPGVKKVDVSQGTEILDSKSSSRNRRTSGKTKQHAASSDENVTKDPSNLADQSSSSVVYEGLEGIRPLNYEVNVKAKGVEKTALIKESDVSQEGNSGYNLDIKTSESSIRGGEESSSSHHKTPTSEQKESLEPIVVSSSHDALKEDTKSSGHLYSEGRESSTGLFESKEKVVDDQEPGPREDLGTSPVSTKASGKNSSSGDRYSPGKLAGSSGLARGVASKGKGNMDFSEAETSTPARHRESSDASEAGASTPTRRRAHSISSEAEASTPTRQKGHSESSESAVASPLQSKGHSELAADILPQPEGPSHLLGSEPPSPAKRRGRSSKQPLKESMEDEEKNKAKVSLIKSAKKSRSGERKSGQNTADIDISLEEQGSKEFDQSLSNVQSFEVDNSKESQNLDQTQEKGDPEVHNSRNTEKDDDSVDIKGEDNVVVKGKRSRSERLSEDGKGSQPVTEHQGSPKLKKKRGDVTGGTESSPEGDQKRKRQDEPEEDHIKRKRKKDDEVRDSSLAVVAETASPEKVVGEDTIKTLSSRFEDGDDNSKMIEEGNNQEAKHSPSSKENKKSVEKKTNSSSPVKGDLIQPQIAEEESTDVEDRRQSSIGSILSFLKRPNVTKKVEDTPDRRGRGDRGSPESKRRDDRKGRAGDRDRKSSESTRRDERKWKTFGEELPDSKRNEDRLGSKERRSRERKSEGHYESQRRDSARNEAQASSAEYGNRNVKDADVTSSYDLGDSTSMTWESMKDMTPVTPSSCDTSSKKRRESKSVIEPDCSSKAGESEAKVDAGEEDDTGVEDRRTSSIGNILSFLKRGNQSGVQPKQSDSESSLEGSKLSHATNEDQIFSFVESTRKSTSESYYAKREDSDSSQKSKGSSKSRERRVSRWSAREPREETADSHGSQWDDAQMYQKSGSLSESRDRNRSKWSEQRNMEEPSFSKWEDMSSECQSQTLSSTKQERKDVALSAKNSGTTKPYSSWNDQGSTWKNWTGDQSHGAYETEHMEDKFRETQKQSKDSVSDDEHTDFSNREGLSEFMESYADELDQSTEGISANISQSHVYHDEIRQGSVNRGSTWHSKSEMELSPNQDMYMLPRGKELSSPPRERVWSPRSNEIVLSPKSRELMSSLRNMEVKLTPQMQELMSSQNKLDSVLPQELHHYPVKQDDNDGDSSSSFRRRKDDDNDGDSSSNFRRRKDGSNAYDIVSIPLPSESELPVSRKQRGSSSSSSQEGTWRSRDRYDRSRARNRYDDVKNEHLKDEDTIKEEDHRDECFDDRSSFVEGIHDDKENLEPKVEDLEISEEEKLEHQRKIDRDLAAKDERSKLVVDQRMKSFFHLQENLYLGDRKKSKRSKEVRRMVCDCSLTKEETAYGEVGCGEDCLNRLLMIECGSRCPLKDRCTNKRFQSYEYATVEVFNAEEKGCGIRARKEIPAGTFIMEYVGEVFDAREFKRRRKEYAKNHNAHFYFMALKGDLFIDATRKGNISRFINHSCDPNAQTQKWTVNGELRVGFFAQKTIEVDEEINFDYRLERYGREPQRCYCGTGICRGWLGESPDEKTKEEKEEEKRQERDRRKREEKRCYVEDIDLEDEIDQLNTIKLRTRQDILNLCRLMVRADNSNSRVMLLRLVQSSTSACKRLFMDYHGLSLLWSWMADLGYAYEHASIKIEILKTLECLPITNKTQLTDSRVLGVVERWSTQSVEVPISGSPPPPPPPRPGHMVSGSANADSDSGKKSSDTSEDSDGEMDAKPASAIIDSSSVDDVSMDSVDVEQDALKSKPSLEGCLAEDDSSDSTLSEEKKSAVEPGEGDAAATATAEDEAVSQELLILHRSMVELAIKLLEQWKDLKEYFRIPKKERIELMKEHEREVEEEIRGLDKDRKDKDNFSSPSRYRRDFDRRRRSPDREKDKERHSRRSARSDRESREDRSSDSPKMSKEQRRQLFEIQVQQEEEEAKQRKMQEEMWAMHVERCRLLGQDPYLTPIFDPSCQYYWDPNTASWQPYNGTDPNIPVPAAYGYRPGENGEGSPMIVGVPPGHVIGTQPLAGHLAPDGEAATPNYDDPRIDLATIPLPGEVRQTSPTQPLPCQAVPVEGTPPQGARVLTFPVPAEPGVAMTPATTMPINLGANAVNVPFMVSEEPPPPPPGPITIQLPPRWKMARDSEGHVYFYHVKSRTSQWEPPTLEQHQQLEAGMGSDSESESNSTDSDSTSTTDSEDFSSDEEEEEEEEEVTTVERGELCDEKMIRRHRAKKPRSETLVQERVISPVLEMDKEAARRERREAKERAQKEARQERQEDRLHEASQDVSEPGDEMETISEKMQRMDRAETVVEKDRHEHRESKSKIRDKTKSKERAATAIADNSDSARKCKENFRARMATYIVSVLNPYRRDDCKIGRITCNEDFKYLARKLTHFVMIKELKQLHSVEDLECNDSVKYKTKDFVRKYMSKYGHEFKRDPSDTKEY